MDSPSVSNSSSSLHSLARFSQASQVIHATHTLDEVLTHAISELHSALDAEAASVALLDVATDSIILYAAGPVAEAVSGLQLPREHGIIGWAITNKQSVIVNNVSVDTRFRPDVDGHTGFQTRSVIAAPLISGTEIVGAVEVLNKRHGGFTTEDLQFLEAFGVVVASAIENAQRFHREQQRRREADTLRHVWEALTTPRDLKVLLDIILDQLSQLIDYRSASILLVADDGGLELGASRGLEDLDASAQMVRKLGLDVKVRTMLETRQPLLIPDTRADPRWQHFAASSYIRSWIGAPLFIKGHLIGTLNVDHDQAGHYSADQARLLTSFAHQAAIAIENSRLYAATRKAWLQLAEQARRMVTLYETSRALLTGLELDQDALYELVSRITKLIEARYGILDILAENIRPRMFITVGFTQAEIADLDFDSLDHSILDILSSEREVIHNNELSGAIGPWQALPAAVLNSFLGVAIHARGHVLGRLLLAGKLNDQPFSQEDESLALALATNLAGTIQNASFYHKTQQRLRELSALYEISRTVTLMTEIDDIFTHLATQVAGLLDAERCAFFIYKDGKLECQPPGFGIPPEMVDQLIFPVTESNPLHAFIHAPEPLISNELMNDPDLIAQRSALAQLNIRRLISCSITIDEQQIGLLVTADKHGGEEFSEQDRHLVSIIANQVSNVLQRAHLQSRQREQAHIQSALLKVSQVISSLTNLDELLQTVAQITHQLVGCDHCLIASWEERQAAFVPRAQSGLDPVLNEALSQMYFRPGELSFIDQATETRSPVLLTRRDIRETVPGWTRGILGLENSLLVPLVVQERAVGLITAAYTRASHPPGDREIALVTGIARQAAIAIENANLYQDLQLHAGRLERAYSELKELDSQKTQFVQNVSHELRTPFTLIKGYLEMLLEEELGDLNDKQKQGLQMVADKTEELGQLIEDIFTIQSIETASLNLRDFELSILLEVSLESFTDWGHRSDVDLQSDLPPDLPLLRADPSLVERAIEHLLDNAIKFSPNGGPVILKARPQGKMMRIEVKDHGIGISAESLPYVFDRFYQADGSTTRRFRGTGLGLSIVRQIAEAHGGQIGGSSIEGEGSTFFFTVPLAPTSKATP